MTDKASWDTASFWGGTLPNSTTDAWFNSVNSYAYVDSSVNGDGHQISIGRSTGNAQLDIVGGSLQSSDEFFVGQYTGASGIVNLTGGTLNVGLNLTIGGTGVGTFNMTGGNLIVASAIKVNRYTATGASGYADISGGTVTAGDLNIGSAGLVVLDNMSLTLAGNRVSEIDGLLGSGLLSTFWGSLAPASVSYNSGTNQTSIVVPNGRYAGIAAIPAGKKGDAPVSFDYSDLRRLSPAPAVGIHPRVVFGPNDVSDIAQRLQNTAWGQSLNTMISDYTLLLRSGAGAYNALPSSARTMPDGSARIGNVGLYDKSQVYNDLVAGHTTQIATMVANNDGTGAYVLSGEMALEAFQCLLNYSQPGYAQRMTNLCNALNTWANYASSLNTLAANGWQFGGFHSAMAYDFAFNYMTPSQQATVRKALAIVLGNFMNGYYGVGLTPAATTSNWEALWTYELLMGYAIEGEVQTSDAGYSASDLAAFQANTMAAMNNFFTYGWSQDGACYEGMGKDYIYGSHQIALAKRGYDFFGNMAVRNYADYYMTALMQPFGYSFTKFDVLGGSGNNSVTGNFDFEANDFIGLKWMNPDDNAVDFCFRNFIYTPYVDANGVQQTFLDPRDSKLTPRSGYSNSLLMAAIFATDVSSAETWAQQRSEVAQLNYHDGDAGTISYLSDSTANAIQLLVHMRNNFGGHTNADRNTFGLSALGRIFVNFNTNITGLQAPDYQSIVDVDGKSMYTTPEEGTKCRIPEKIAGWVENDNASFITGDATYAYSNQWAWQNYVSGATFTPKSGFVADNSTFNTFRRSNSQIGDSHGSIPFVSYPAWDHAGYNEGIEKASYNPMQQVYRTIGLVRGNAPYVLVVDDVQKDANAHDYRWYASVATDLTLLTGSSLPAGFNSATDAVLQEPSKTGNRRLLVRVLRAAGTQVQAAGTTGSPLAYLQTIADPVSSTLSYNRLVVERSNVSAPGYIMMLFPLNAGGAIPTTSWSGNTLTVEIGTQIDTYNFAPRTAIVAGQTVTMNEFNLMRGGTTVLDYRNQIEPTPVR